MNYIEQTWFLEPFEKKEWIQNIDNILDAVVKTNVVLWIKNKINMMIRIKSF